MDLAEYIGFLKEEKSENLTIIELRNAYKEGRIEKKLYWRMLRERFLPLIELQKSIQDSGDDCSVEINGRDIILTRAGVRLSFDFSQTFCRAEGILSLGGNPEQEDFDYITSFLNPGDVVLDIGANVGLVSISLLKSQPNVEKIYTFEPLPDTYEKMKQNLELNGNPEKIHPVNVGMSDNAGTFDFYLPGENEAASMQPNMDEFYMQESVDGHYTGVKKMDKVECKVTTLDDYVAENNIDRVNFIKIDVEGNEKNVLLGGRAILKKYHPVVYCEMLRKHAARFGYHPNEIIEYMKSLDYKCYTLHDGRLIPFTEMTEDTVETNFFFCK